MTRSGLAIMMIRMSGSFWIKKEKSFLFWTSMGLRGLAYIIGTEQPVCRLHQILLALTFGWVLFCSTTFGIAPWDASWKIIYALIGERWRDLTNSSRKKSLIAFSKSGLIAKPEVSLAEKLKPGPTRSYFCIQPPFFFIYPPVTFSERFELYKWEMRLIYS